MRIRFLTWTQVLLILGFSLLLVACGDDDDDTPAEETDPVTLVRQGWSAFESLNYLEALDLFDQALSKGEPSSDAYSGAGWTSYEMGDLAAARDYWDLGLVVDNESFDIRAGMGFLEFDQENYSASVAVISELLVDNSNYQFVHMPGLDYRDLQITRASAYYMQGMMDEALLEVQALNPLFDADVQTPNGVAELIDEIERLADVYR